MSHEIVSKEYYSNCMIEAIKAKLKNRKVKIFLVLVNQCVDIDLKRHQLIATDILHAMPVTIVPDCT